MNVAIFPCQHHGYFDVCVLFVGCLQMNDTMAKRKQEKKLKKQQKQKHTETDTA